MRHLFIPISILFAWQPCTAQPNDADALAEVMRETTRVRAELDLLEQSIRPLRFASGYPPTPQRLRHEMEPIVRGCDARVTDWRFGVPEPGVGFTAYAIEMEMSAPHPNPLACVATGFVNASRFVRLDTFRAEFDPQGAQGRARITLFENPPRKTRPAAAFDAKADPVARLRADFDALRARRADLKAEFEALSAIYDGRRASNEGMVTALQQIAEAEPLRGVFEWRHPRVHLSGTVRRAIPNPSASLVSDGVTVEPFVAPALPTRLIEGAGTGQTIRVLGADAKRLRWILQPSGRSMMASAEPGPPISATLTGRDTDAIFAALEAAEPTIGTPLDMKIERGPMNVQFIDLDAHGWARLSSGIDRVPTFAADPGQPLLITAREVSWAALDAAVLARWGFEKSSRDGLTWLMPKGQKAPAIDTGDGQPTDVYFSDVSAAEALRLLGVGAAACGGRRFGFSGRLTPTQAAQIALRLGGVERRDTAADCPGAGPAALLGTLAETTPARAIYRDAKGVVRVVESQVPKAVPGGPTPEVYALEHGHPPPVGRTVSIETWRLDISGSADAITLDDGPRLDAEVARSHRLVATIEGPTSAAVFATPEGRWFRIDAHPGLRIEPTVVRAERGRPPFVWHAVFPLGAPAPGAE